MSCVWAELMDDTSMAASLSSNHAALMVALTARYGMSYQMLQFQCHRQLVARVMMSHLEDFKPGCFAMSKSERLTFWSPTAPQVDVGHTTLITRTNSQKQ